LLDKGRADRPGIVRERSSPVRRGGRFPPGDA